MVVEATGCEVVILSSKEGEGLVEESGANILDASFFTRTTEAPAIATKEIAVCHDMAPDNRDGLFVVATVIVFLCIVVSLCLLLIIIY